jgi:hypothetical protein
MALDPFFSPIETSLAYSFTSPAWEVIKEKCPEGFDINLQLFCFMLDIKTDLLAKLKALFDIDVQNIKVWEDLTVKKSQIEMLDALIKMLDLLLEFLNNFGECFNSEDLLNDFFAVEFASGYMKVEEFLDVAYDAGIPIDEALTLAQGTPVYRKKVKDLFTSKGLPPGSDILTLFAPIDQTDNQSEIEQDIIKEFRPYLEETPQDLRTKGVNEGKGVNAEGVDPEGKLISPTIPVDTSPTKTLQVDGDDPGVKQAIDFIRAVDEVADPLNLGNGGEAV